MILTMETATPANVGEASEAIRQAARAGSAIFPFGGGTKCHLGFPPSKTGTRLNTLKLNRLIDYPARDMTITVQAGIHIAQLRQILAKEGQCLPVDDPFIGNSTLGGALAANCSGPRRYGWGTLRDYVIGISIINDQGVETKAGGRVVKNVAGYDFCKLHTGAMGTLGVISQVTLKVRPKPETSSIAVIGLGKGELESALELAHSTATRPVCIELLNQPAVSHLKPDSANSSHDWVLLIGYEHNEKAVRWQEETLTAEFARRLKKEVQLVNHGKDQAIWEALEKFQANQPEASQVTIKINVTPAKAAAFSLETEGFFPNCLVQSHAGSGIIHCHINGMAEPQIKQGILALQEKAARMLGNCVIPRCPEEWKSVLPVWGRPREDWGLMRKVKRALDPHELFNPGRFVDRI